MRVSVLLVCFGLFAAGCGYTSGYRMPEGVHALAVPIFRNETFPLRREVEFDLTRAVRREFESRTDVRLVDRDRADAVLEGTVVEFEERILSEGRNDVVQESSVEIGVRCRLVNVASGEVLFDEHIRDQSSFSPLRGETVDTARAESIDEIAERLVARVEGW